MTIDLDDIEAKTRWVQRDHDARFPQRSHSFDEEPDPPPQAPLSCDEALALVAMVREAQAKLAEWEEKDGNSPGYNRDKARTYGRIAHDERQRAKQAEARVRDLEDNWTKALAWLRSENPLPGVPHELIDRTYAARRFRAGYADALERGDHLKADDEPSTKIVDDQPSKEASPSTVRQLAIKECLAAFDEAAEWLGRGGPVAAYEVRDAVAALLDDEAKP